MTHLKFSILLIFICIALSSCNNKQVGSSVYHVSISGNDVNDGSCGKPWKTLNPENISMLRAGDTVFFAAGETFEMSLLIDSLVSGTHWQPIVIASCKKNPATIHSGNGLGLKLQNSAHVKIGHLNFTGSGRKDGNTHPGVHLVNCRDVTVSNLDIQGYQKSGLHIHASSNIVAGHVNAHNNGFSGILVSGVHGRKDASRNIHIHDCFALNNPGDPTALRNHSGNGILVGNCTNVLIEYCAATENGWDMPRTGNGPVGIWAYEADSVVIQHCISYRNKTQKGAADGGGFDFDGGVSNSMIQYCLSYENEGPAFGLFQYASASPWYNNTVRYCVSVNDGCVSNGKASLFIWNATDDVEKLKDCYVYNNTIYNEHCAAISYEQQNHHSGFHFYNNIFIAKKFFEGVETPPGAGIYEANNWYSLASTNESPKGANNQNILPRFKNSENFKLTDPRQLSIFDAYHLTGDASPLRTSGIDLKERFGWSTGEKNFNGRQILKNGIGACQ